MDSKELAKAMGPYNPNQSHHSRMTKQGIILAKHRKAEVQRELDEKIASKSKSKAIAKKLKSNHKHFELNRGL